MNGFERIAGTIDGKPLDRRAFIPTLSLYGARLIDCPLDQYFSDPAAYTAGQAAVYREFEPDMLCGPLALALVGAAFGSDIKIPALEAPNIRKPGISSLKEWEQKELPDPDRNPYLRYFKDTIRLMAAEFKGKAPVAACLPAPIDIPALVLGMEGWLELVLFDPDGARRVLKKVNTFFVRLANGLFEQGAMVTILPCGYASPTVLTRDPMASVLRPAMDEALGQLKGPAVLHHCGADLLGHLDLLTGLPSTIGFALNYQEGLTRAREVVGPEPVLFSGPHGPSLVEMVPDQVEAVCTAILEERDRAKDRHFVLVTLGADVLYKTAPENLHAMRRALDRMGWNAA